METLLYQIVQPTRRTVFHVLGHKTGHLDYRPLDCPMPECSESVVGPPSFSQLKAHQNEVLEGDG